jgi:hypothetical protein
MVYVDNLNKSYQRMKLCHMMADTTAELEAMAETLRHHGYRGRIQHPGTAQEHYDINLHYKAMAVRMGAKIITKEGSVRIVKAKLLAGARDRHSKKSF